MGKTLAQQFLTPEEQESVKSAVRAAERRTSGEIVPMIVSSSHSYPSAAILGGGILGGMVSLLLTACVAHLIWSGINELWIFLVLFICCTPVTGFLVSRTNTLKRLFLTEHQMEGEVQKSAFISFFTENLHKTKDENGVLLYISLFERKAWILGDTNINKKIPFETWQHIVDGLTRGIREQQQAEALCRAIDEVTQILATHFPWQKDDEDELKNLILEERPRQLHNLVIH